MMANLVLLQSGEAIPFELAAAETVLGRNSDCEIQLESNMVSRRHAAIQQDGNDYYLNDLGSGNGTFLNGKRIAGRALLSHRDRIKLGPVLLRYEDAPPEKSAVESKTFRNDETGIFQLEISAEHDESSVITGTAGSHSGYGLLTIRPEAKLQGVLEISRSLAGNVKQESLLPRILETLFNIFPTVDRGCILLKNETTGEMIAAAQKHRRQNDDETVRLSRTIYKKVLEEKTAVLSADAASDSRFASSESISNLTIRSMMCAPLLGLDGEVIGMINLDTQNPINHFQEDDLDLLIAVANQAAMSYESARLFISFAEKEKQDRELEIARGVQHALLPAELPTVDGYKIYASYDSAQAVGGDYYDAGLLGENKIFLALGDVAGKGVPGALIMSRLSSVVQTTMAFTDDVPKAIATINNHMCANAVEGRFVTFVLVIIDLSTHEMTLINAGHMPPIIRQPDGSIDEFQGDTIGIPIGIYEDYSYQVVKRTLKLGETVIIVTDGVDEAMNADSELYTKERVIDFIQNGPSDAEELGTSLLTDVRRHADGRPQNDDITIMAFGRNA